MTPVGENYENVRLAKGRRGCNYSSEYEWGWEAPRPVQTHTYTRHHSQRLTGRSSFEPRLPDVWSNRAGIHETQTVNFYLRCLRGLRHSAWWGHNCEPSLKSINTILQWCSTGFRWGPAWYRDSSLSDGCTPDRWIFSCMAQKLLWKSRSTNEVINCEHRKY